jgi:N-acylneuraminate cytidylyltransferase
VSAIAIIPARGGSTRIRGKNIRDFLGKPIITYPITTAISSGLFSAVWVSTDSDDIASVVRRFGAGIIDRPHALARNDVGTQAVMAHALRALGHYDYACCIYATAPLMTVDDLHGGYERLRKGGAPYVYSVGPDFIDAGQWYWGRTLDFLAGVPLDQAELYVLPADRVCDINTEEDWMRAEKLYANQMGAQCG